MSPTNTRDRTLIDAQARITLQVVTATTTIVTLWGDHDLASEAELISVLHLSAEHGNVVVDLSHGSRIDFSAIRH